MPINRERMTKTQGVHESIVTNTLLSSLSFLVKTFEDEI